MSVERLLRWAGVVGIAAALIVISQVLTEAATEQVTAFATVSLGS
jgi:hypothetical protein